jgi:hypothetical protein
VELTVKNIHEVLKQKEAECARLRHEIEALRIVVPLLDEKAASNRTVLREEEAAAESSMGAAEEREVHKTEPEIDVDRKEPLSTSISETSWWKRAK